MRHLFLVLTFCLFFSFCEAQYLKHEIKLDIIGALEGEAQVAYEYSFSEKWSYQFNLAYLWQGRRTRTDQYIHFGLGTKYYVNPLSKKGKVYLGFGLGGRFFVQSSARKDFYNQVQAAQILPLNDNPLMLGPILQQGAKWLICDRWTLDLQASMLFNVIDFSRKADAFPSVALFLAYRL